MSWRATLRRGRVLGATDATAARPSIGRPDRSASLQKQKREAIDQLQPALFDTRTRTNRIADDDSRVTGNFVAQHPGVIDDGP